MYILKNAWLSITRSKGRNILIGIIVVLIAVASCIALSIKNSAKQVVVNYKNASEITATLSLDRRALMQDAQTNGQDIREVMTSITSPTLDEIKKYGSSTYLKSYYYTIQTSFNGSGIDPVDTNSWWEDSQSSENNNANNNNTQGQNGAMPGGRGFGRIMGDFRVTGYSSSSAMQNFINGTYKMSSGAMFEDGETSNVCVITDELAQLNDLSVGSKITFVNPADEAKTFEFTVGGIYTDTSNTGDDQMISNAFSDSANQIITSFTALNNIITASQQAADAATDSNTTDTQSGAQTDTSLRAQVSSNFILKNADSLEGFKTDLTTMGLNKYYTVQTNLDTVEQSLTPLNNLNSFATVFLIVVLVIGGIILIVLNMINIRERKYEVGVLRAIGMKKGKVTAQFIIELFMVTIIALVIGSAIGASASVPTANKMLESQISAQESQQQQIGQNFGRGEGFEGGRQAGNFPGGNAMGRFFGLRENVNYVEQINAVMDAKVLMQIALIGVVLTLFSSSVAVVFISRYEPLKILSNRS